MVHAPNRNHDRLDLDDVDHVGLDHLDNVDLGDDEICDDGAGD